MKTNSFTIPIYEVDVTVIQIEGAFDLESIERFCEDNSIEFTEAMQSNIERGFRNGGDTFRNLDLRQIFVFLYPFDNLTERVKVVEHEKRHIEDRILQYFGVDDIESAALLAGFLGEHLSMGQFLKWKKSNCAMDNGAWIRLSTEGMGYPHYTTHIDEGDYYLHFDDLARLPKE